MSTETEKLIEAVLFAPTLREDPVVLDLIAHARKQDEALDRIRAAAWPANGGKGASVNDIVDHLAHLHEAASFGHPTAMEEETVPQLRAALAAAESARVEAEARASRGRTSMAAVRAALREFPDASFAEHWVPAEEALAEADEYRHAWKRDLAKGREATEAATRRAEAAERERDEARAQWASMDPDDRANEAKLRIATTRLAAAEKARSEAEAKGQRDSDLRDEAEQQRDALRTALAERTAQLDAALGTPCEVMALRERVEMAEACVVGLREAAKGRDAAIGDLYVADAATKEDLDRGTFERRDRAADALRVAEAAYQAALADAAPLAARVLAEAERRGEARGKADHDEALFLAQAAASTAERMAAEAREERDAARRDALNEAARMCHTQIALTPFDSTSHIAKFALVAAAKAIRGLLAEPSPRDVAIPPEAVHAALRAAAPGANELHRNLTRQFSEAGTSGLVLAEPSPPKPPHDCQRCDSPAEWTNDAERPLCDYHAQREPGYIGTARLLSTPAKPGGGA